MISPGTAGSTTSPSWGAGPNDDLAHGECSYEFRDYLLKDGTLIPPLNVTGLERWVPQLNAWLVLADSWIYLVDENGNVLTKRKISETAGTQLK